MKKFDRIENKIIQVAIHEIKANGYEHLSLRGLVKKVYLTTGAFYKRFPNKKSLFLNVTKIISLKVYQQVLPKIGNYKQNPRKSLINLGVSIIKLFNTRPNLMNFLFFNNELSVVYQNAKLGSSFPLLKLAKRIIALSINNKTSINKEFIKLWSFIQGYGNLINNNVCEFDMTLVKEALNQMLGSNANE